jgi:CubicO group peptidase (beta-lactamase class C family)
MGQHMVGQGCNHGPTCRLRRRFVGVGTLDILSDDRFLAADDILREGVAAGVFTHSVYAVAAGGVPVATGAFGGGDGESIFDLASLTKPLSTAVLALRLVEQGALSVDQSVASLFAGDYGALPALEAVTIHHLLTHTSGLPSIPSWEPGVPRREMIGTALHSEPKAAPGAVYTYSDTGYILLGEIVSRVAGLTQDRLFDDAVAGPLGLKRLRYLPPAEWSPALVPTTPGAEPGIVHDPRARDLGGVAGHAGLFGTAADVLACADAIRAGGAPLLTPESAALMSGSQIPSPIGAMSYGLFCGGNVYRPAGDLFSERAYGHSGFTGTLILIDPAIDATVVLLTNRVWNAAEGNARYLAVRNTWLNAVAQALIPAFASDAPKQNRNAGVSE